MDEGFTPVAFALGNSKEYEIGAANYGRFHFYFWGQARGGDAIFPIKVAETGDVLLYAYYVIKDSETDTSSTTSELTVSTEDRSSNPIHGYWTVLSHDGGTVETGFSPATFTLDNGENYVVLVADYGQYVFDYWRHQLYNKR